MTSAAALEAALGAARAIRAGGDEAGGAATGGAPATPRRRKLRSALAEPEEAEKDSAPDEPKVSASDRRGAAAALIGIWASLARDLAVVARGGDRQAANPQLLEEVRAVSPKVNPARLRAFIDRLTELGAGLDDNLNPELALDVLALAWPRSEQMGTVALAAPRR